MRGVAAGVRLVLLALALALGLPLADSHEPLDAAAAGDIAVAELPAEARETLALIRRGGPFPYRRDGSVFGNREKRLPQRPYGYYTEYTVRTPNARDRGGRRIVAGRGNARSPAASGEYWYTEDHYNSFRRIRE
jgi:ribonuclease T1